MPQPRDWVTTCPYCSASPAPFQPSGGLIDTAGPDGRPRRWHAGACPACGGLAVFEIELQSGRIVAMHPEYVGEWKIDHLSPAIETISQEAVSVFRVGAYASAVVACGRALEQAGSERGIAGHTLQARITKMAEEGHITTEFREVMDYVRLIRNVGAHAGQPVSQQSAEGTMRFTQQTLRLLFEVPGELDRLTAHPPELEVNGADTDEAA